ncbi:MAG TPA: FAD-dependent oxidoreductase, partial [Chloroflexia bacterium]|nr:FAD-dependent oxidoreductase [Chloroflexia bacterium]
MSDSVGDTLAGRYPLTVAAFSSMEDGDRALKAVTNLQQQWVTLNRESQSSAAISYAGNASSLPSCPAANRFDVVIAGGGLGLLAGAALARRGLKVLVFDKDRVGAAHREWNISQPELESLPHWGIFQREELEAAVAARYSAGIISFDAAGTEVPHCPLKLNGVLDVALDAQSVLDLARRRFLEHGGIIKEGLSFERLHIARTGEVASVFEVIGPAGREFYRARLAIDMMGSVSPIARTLNEGLPFDGVCPTAGTVVEGLEGSTDEGDVLVSIAPVSDGRQLIWEGFPGANGETTVYLF